MAVPSTLEHKEIPAMPIYYTYLIGWSNASLFYYGVRYAKNAHPSELFITYFTSSKHVKHYIAKYGNPDIIQIRKTFTERHKAINWEHNVLKRMNLKEDTRFLNATNNPGIAPANFNRGANLSEWNKKSYDEKFTKEQRLNMARLSSIRMSEMHAKGLITYNKPEDTTNYKTAANIRLSDPTFKAKAKSRQHYYNLNTKTSRMLLPEEVTCDWNLGRMKFS